MIFNSLTFLVFLAITTLLYWLLPRRARIIMIFISSLVFYGFWRWEFLSVMLISAITDFWVSLRLEKVENKPNRFRLLLLSIIVNLGLLIFFKYLYFITDNLNTVAQLFGKQISLGSFKIVLPLGISFYTFQTMSYTIDVYRGFLKPEKNFFLFGSYVTYFPQLVAGPILRASEIMSQLDHRLPFKMSFLLDGFKRILIGMFLKVVLADNIASLVDEGFNLNPNTLSALDVWTLSFLFGFQIYFDFAGYSHIAIGCAKLMGIHFPENFNFPYAASSFKSFWKRWHISLSSWIRDYLYLPLAGSKVINKDLQSEGGLGEIIDKKVISTARKDRALFGTWAIMGLWHGANWTYVVWGVYHATMIFIERLIKKLSFNKLQTPAIGWLIVVPFAMLGWIPFRAQSVSDVMTMFSKVINPSAYLFITMRENTYLITALLFLFASVAFILDYYKQKMIERTLIIYWLFESLKYAIIISTVFIFLRPIAQFIYFQF